MISIIHWRNITLLPGTFSLLDTAPRKEGDEYQDIIVRVESPPLIARVLAGVSGMPGRLLKLSYEGARVSRDPVYRRLDKAFKSTQPSSMPVTNYKYKGVSGLDRLMKVPAD